MLFGGLSSSWRPARGQHLLALASNAVAAETTLMILHRWYLPPGSCRRWKRGRERIPSRAPAGLHETWRHLEVKTWSSLRRLRRLNVSRDDEFQTNEVELVRERKCPAGWPRTAGGSTRSERTTMPRPPADLCTNAIGRGRREETPRPSLAADDDVEDVKKVRERFFARIELRV